MTNMTDITWLIMPMIVYAAGNIKQEELPKSIDLGIVPDAEFASVHWNTHKMVEKIVSDTWTIVVPEDSMNLWYKVHRYTGEQSRAEIVFDLIGSVDDFESDLSALLLVMPKMTNYWDYITYHVKY